MSTRGVIGTKGLHLNGNELLYPPGSLTQADNCAIWSSDLLQPRRGQTQAVSVDGGLGVNSRGKAMWQWGDVLFVNYVDSSVYGLSSFDATGTFSAVGAYAPPAPTILRMKFAELAKSAYWTTSTGLYTISGYGGTVRAAGVKAPKDFAFINTAGSGTRLASNPNASGTFLATNTQVAGRAVLGYKDANNVIHLSKPSGRAVIINPADVTVAAGSLSRAGTTVVATLSAAHDFQIGDVFALSPGEANYPTGNKTVTAITSTSITYSEAGAAGVSGVQQTISSGTKTIQWVAMIPSGLSTSYFVQIYRTDESATSAVDPGDECFLAYERYLTATDISNGYVTVQDTTPSARLGGPLATNANTADGINLGSNERPPLCRDLCVWDGKLWGAATTDSHRLSVRLLGTGTPNGLQSGDVVILDSRAYVAGTDFTLTTEFAPSRNVMRTAQSLVYNFNNTAANSAKVLRCLMADVEDETWGKVLLEEDGVGGSAMYAATDRQSAFAEALPLAIAVTEASTTRTTNVVTVTTATSHGFTTNQVIMLATSSADANFAAGTKTVASTPSGTTFTYAETGSNATMGGTYFVCATTFKSDNNQKPLRFSKQGQPECWPLPFFPGGLPDGADVLRIKPTPDGGELFIFLNHGDIYALSGQYPYSIRRVTGSATLMAADSLVEHANALYGLTSQGVASIRSGGVMQVGQQIEETIRQELAEMALSSIDLGQIFAVSYESDRQYQLWIPTDSTPDHAYVYSSALGTWTRLDSISRTGGVVVVGALAATLSGLSSGAADVLLMSDGASVSMVGERKYFGSTFWLSMADFQYIITGCSATASTTITTASGLVSNLAAGDAIKFGANYYRIVSTVPGVSITVDRALTIAAATGFAGKFFTTTFKFALDSAGLPGIEKVFREIQLHFSEKLFSTLTVTFANEKGSTTKTVTVTDPNFAFKSPTLTPTTTRIEVPNDLRRSAMLFVTVSLAEAFSYFNLMGYSATSEASTERTGR